MKNAIGGSRCAGPVMGSCLSDFGGQAVCAEQNKQIIAHQRAKNKFFPGEAS